MCEPDDREHPELVRAVGSGLLGILASWAYSAGPWPFGRHGFADPLFFLFFGTMSVIGTNYVQAAVVLGPSTGGRRWSRAEFLCLLAFAYLAPFWLWRALGFSTFALPSLITLPLAALVAHAVWARERLDDLVPTTPRMAMLTVAFALCLSVVLLAR